ncbi:hypothetical protein C8F01DRAFT_1370956 [Mycena amicta]|nr:hypothetical protein C8F01DRAFT_1370956 [Mycena amicta]
MSTPPTKPKSPFSSVRRVVTGHTPEGKSTFIDDSAQTARYWKDDAASQCYDLHYCSAIPATNDGKWVDEIVDHPEVPPAPSGSSLRCWDFAPGEVTPIHRTLSLDYGIVFKGTIVLELENGERLTLKEGDTVVQRGTIHTWRNETDEWTKIYFVMIGAKPVEIAGKKLELEFRDVE